MQRTGSPTRERHQIPSAARAAREDTGRPTVTTARICRKD
jgi:hypothetical protein